jgi:hypothetical protein
MTLSDARGKIGKTIVVLSVASICALIVLFGFSSKSENHHLKVDSHQNALDEALARQYDCPILQAQVDKATGNRTAYTIHIQRVLGSNKRLVAEGALLDVVESNGQAEAVFELVLPIATEQCCITRLKCPTNLISTLTADVPSTWWTFVFDVGENQQDLRFSKASEDDTPTAYSVLTIEGKLIEAAK